MLDFLFELSGDDREREGVSTHKRYTEDNTALVFKFMHTCSIWSQLTCRKAKSEKKSLLSIDWV